MEIKTVHLQAKIVRRSARRSVVAAAAYRAGQRLRDLAAGTVRDYSKRKGVLRAELMVPEWASSSGPWADRENLWNAVERTERRKDAQLARELEIALPDALTDAQREALLWDFCRREFVAKGMIADIALHRGSAGDVANHHAHVLLTMRRPEGRAFGPKERSWNAPALLDHWKAAWQADCNDALAAAGIAVRLDRRSIADRRQAALQRAEEAKAAGDEPARRHAFIEAEALDYIPRPNIGPAAWQAMQAGRHEDPRFAAKIATWEASVQSKADAEARARALEARFAAEDAKRGEDAQTERAVRNSVLSEILSALPDVGQMVVERSDLPPASASPTKAPIAVPVPTVVEQTPGDRGIPKPPPASRKGTPPSTLAPAQPPTDEQRIAESRRRAIAGLSRPEPRKGAMGRLLSAVWRPTPALDLDALTVRLTGAVEYLRFLWTQRAGDLLLRLAERAYRAVALPLNRARLADPKTMSAAERGHERDRLDALAAPRGEDGLVDPVYQEERHEVLHELGDVASADRKSFAQYRLAFETLEAEQVLERGMGLRDDDPEEARLRAARVIARLVAEPPAPPRYTFEEVQIHGPDGDPPYTASFDERAAQLRTLGHTLEERTGPEVAELALQIEAGLRLNETRRTAFLANPTTWHRAQAEAPEIARRRAAEAATRRAAEVEREDAAEQARRADARARAARYGSRNEWTLRTAAEPPSAPQSPVEQKRKPQEPKKPVETERRRSREADGRKADQRPKTKAPPPPSSDFSP